MEQGIDKIAALDAATREQVITAYRVAIVHTFYAGASFAGLALVTSLLLPNVKLRGGRQGGHR
jgi:hypothetical protein